MSGKTIHPYVAYAVSGVGGTAHDYQRLCPDATIGESFAVRGEEVSAGAPDVAEWLQRTSISS